MAQPIFFKSLYAYLIAPFWWIHSTATAYSAIKDANVVIMTLTAVPTYLLARMLVTLDQFSSGRVILGAGVGWLEAEFDALGVPFKERGRRMDEGIAMQGTSSHPLTMTVATTVTTTAGAFSTST